MTNTQFRFTIETLTQLVTVSANKNAAVALAAREAATAKLTQREFGLALQNASASLGCTSTIYGLALTMAKEGASLENMVKAMDDKYHAMRTAAQEKREEAEAKKALEKATPHDSGIGNLKNLTPIEQAHETLEKAKIRVDECKAELEKAEKAVIDAEANVNAVQKADEDARAELARLEEQKKEIAPVLSILAELKPLTKKDAEEAFKAQRAAVHAAKKARKTA